MRGPSNMSPRLHMMLLLEKAHGLLQFSSSEECDALFVQVASFTSRCLENKKFLRDLASQVSVEKLVKQDLDAYPVEELQKRSSCSCVPLSGLCDPSSNNMKLCSCCVESIGGPQGTNIEGDSVDACADCLCLLQKNVSLDYGFL